MHSKLSAAYAVRHYAQRGSGTYTDSPGSFREGRLLSVGCSQPSRDSLHMESLSVSGDTKVGIQGEGLNLGGRGRLDVVFRDRVRMCNGSVLVLLSW